MAPLAVSQYFHPMPTLLAFSNKSVLGNTKNGSSNSQLLKENILFKLWRSLKIPGICRGDRLPSLENTDTGISGAAGIDIPLPLRLSRCPPNGRS